MCFHVNICRIVNGIPTLDAMWLSIKLFLYLGLRTEPPLQTMALHIPLINKAILEHSTHLLLICLYDLMLGPVNSIRIDSYEKSSG